MDGLGYIFGSLILGAGISGISAGYHAQLNNKKCLILKKGLHMDLNLITLFIYHLPKMNTSEVVC